ncbi:MAG TPA: hypothetical protein VGG92_22485 [Caulobacteraceae bacterium]|jgi:hypothetical protein
MTSTSLAGDWAYRFSGFTIMESTPCYLVGMGVLTLGADGTIKGKQTASITPLTGTGQKLIHAGLEVSGTYSTGDGVWGSSKLTFLDQNENEVGTFDILHVDPDRFWMISTGAKQMPGSTPADEVNSGEAVRIKPLN